MRIGNGLPSADPLNTQESTSPARAHESGSPNAAEQKEDTAVRNVSLPPSSERELKIAELRRSYLDGTYQIRVEEISGKIVDEHISMTSAGETEL
jgi:anti-sigma28 factor (negative regulator of flagellin synthesis)